MSFSGGASFFSLFSFLEDALPASRFAAASAPCSLVFCFSGEKQKKGEIGTRKKGNEEKITLTPLPTPKPLDPPSFPEKNK